jgi:DNA-binding transcriptional ArsR family regulator
MMPGAGPARTGSAGSDSTGGPAGRTIGIPYATVKHMFDGEVVGLRAIAHPLRLRILSMLTGEQLSASELARRLDESAANVSYHLRRLHRAGLVELVGTDRIRGGVAKVYRHDPASGESLRTGVGFAALAASMAEALTRRAGQLADAAVPTFTDLEARVDAATAAEAVALARRLGEVLSNGAVAADAAGVTIAATVAVFPIADQRSPR